MGHVEISPGLTWQVVTGVKLMRPIIKLAAISLMATFIGACGVAKHSALSNPPADRHKRGIHSVNPKTINSKNAHQKVTYDSSGVPIPGVIAAQLPNQANHLHIISGLINGEMMTVVYGYYNTKTMQPPGQSFLAVFDHKGHKIVQSPGSGPVWGGTDLLRGDVSFITDAYISNGFLIASVQDIGATSGPLETTVWQYGRGVFGFSKVHILDVKTGQSEDAIATENAGDIKQDGNQFIISTGYYGPNDPLCCPSGTTKYILTYSGFNGWRVAEEDDTNTPFSQ